MSRHLCGGPSRKGQQHDPPRVDVVDDEVCNAVRKRICLSRARTRDNQERVRFGKNWSAKLVPTFSNP
jgi:hypothetical protein